MIADMERRDYVVAIDPFPIEDVLPTIIVIISPRMKQLYQ
jgi:hypothetical protein